ncbi:hypothetical protein Pelo_15834 [Pelomyxa schiedti]|nr:hypothetical protein Pelo_15828 [Pelomyxa schiedti]KAH3742777.1 hypothetical protein Pelo_15834 [Pelomyxa schiedti]
MSATFPYDSQRCQALKHIMNTSRVVWDNVVAPGWLDSDREGDGRGGLWAFAAAGAMFPLVALVCTRSQRRARADGCSRYPTLWAAAKAGSGSCVAWIVARHRRDPLHSPNSSRACALKEAAWVLSGLCASGNVEAARALLGSEGRGGGTFPYTLWDGYRVPEWHQNQGSSSIDELRNDLLENVKSGGSVMGAGCSDNVESAKWFVSVLGITGDDSLWALLPLVEMALMNGKLDVAKWAIGEFDLLLHSRSCQEELVSWCTAGTAPENLKWCVENFPNLPTDCGLLYSVLGNKHGTVELCQWLRARFPAEEISDYILGSIKSIDVAKLVLSTILVEPRIKMLNKMCQHIADVSFLEWLITERNFTPTAATFIMVCSTSRGGYTLPQWLSTRVKLGPADIQASLEHALLWSNTTIADWLESTFGVMGTVNSCPESPGAMLVQICRKCADYKDRLGGLRWFLQHLTHPDQITAASVHKAIAMALPAYRSKFVLHLLEVFPKYKPQAGDTELLESMFDTFVKWSHEKLQKLVTLFDCSLFTRELVVKTLTSKPFRPFTSKSIKWAITQFHLEDTHIKRNYNSLLYSLILHKKANCAEWLIDHFGIAPHEVIDMFVFWNNHRERLDFDIDLQTWKMIVRRFPSLDVDVIRGHLMPIAAHSPSIALFTMNNFGITVDEIRHQFDDYHDRDPETTEYKPRLTEELMLWLGIP